MANLEITVEGMNSGVFFLYKLKGNMCLMDFSSFRRSHNVSQETLLG